MWSLLQEKEYSTTAELLAPSARVEGTPSWQVKANNPELVTQDSVAERVADDLDQRVTAAEASGNVEASASGESDRIRVTASDPDPRFAAQLANAFAENSLQAFKPNDARILTRAKVPTSPSSSRVTRNTAVGAVLGFLLGAVIALLLELLDRSIRRADELEEAFGLPLLGSIPNSKALASFVTNKGASNSQPAPLPVVETEALRMLRTRLRYFNADRDFRSVVVTSAVPREGKTTVAAHLAMTEAGAGSRVLLMEADLRKPVLAAAAGLRSLPGLAEILTGQSALAVTVQRVTRFSNAEQGKRDLDVIVAGSAPPNPVELIEGRNMATLLQELTAVYDLVVIDAPPPTVLADAIPLIKLAGGVVVVAQLGKITRDDAARLREQLRGQDAHVLGVVANRAPKGREQLYSYYSRRARPRPRLWDRPIASQARPGGLRSQAPRTASQVPRDTGNQAGSGES